MKVITRSVVGTLRRSWIGPVAASIAVPLALATQALRIIDAPWMFAAETVTALGGAGLCLALGLTSLVSSLKTQPKRRGQSTFERIHALAEPPGSDLHLVGNPIEGVRPPKWMSTLGTTLPKPFPIVEGVLALATLGAVLVLTNAPDAWIAWTIGPYFLDQQIRVVTVFGLIGVIGLQSLRLACQTFIRTDHSPS